MRLHRRWIVQAVVLALFAPVLLGLLPDSSRLAEAMLARDLAFSICSTDSQGETPDEQHGPAHAGFCVLCSVCAAAASRSPAEAVLAFAEPGATPAPAYDGLTALIRPPQSLRLLGSPPRGPPSSLLI